MRPDVTVVTGDVCSHFHTRAWRTSVWNRLTYRDAQRDRPTDIPAQGHLLQEEPEECGHKRPQSQPPGLPTASRASVAPEQTHRCPFAESRPARARVGLLWEAGWSQAHLHLTC